MKDPNRETPSTDPVCRIVFRVPAAIPERPRADACQERIGHRRHERPKSAPDEDLLADELPEGRAAAGPDQSGTADLHAHKADHDRPRGPQPIRLVRRFAAMIAAVIGKKASPACRAL